MVTKSFYFKRWLLAVVFCLVAFGLRAQSQMDEDKTLSPYFVVVSDHGESDMLPLKETSVQSTIVGTIADVTVRQVYVNCGKNPIEAIYTFPMSTRAAVYGMKMTIGKRVVRAKIEEKNKARKDYEKAKSEGNRASLLEQSRPNVFTMNVSNIMVGDTIEVELNYTELLVPEKGVYSFVYPTVVGPRYSKKDSRGAGAEDDFVATPYTRSGELPTYKFDYQLTINSGVPIQDVTCTSHKMKLSTPNLNKAVLHLDASEVKGGNRDVIVNFSLCGGTIESGMLLYEGEEENFFMLMAQPPKKVQETDIPPREYIFIVDVSGSMRGFSMDVSKKLMQNLITNLKEGDKFNVVLFSSNAAIFSSQSVDATQDNMQRAMDFIQGANNWSGTEVLDALKTAYAIPQADEDMSRMMVIVTDGYVDVEKECFEMIRQHNDKANFFAFGIGRSVNRYLIEGMAFAGNGEPMIVTEESEALSQAARFREYVNTPVLTHVKFSPGGFQAYDVEPMTMPDMMAERPVVIFGKYKGLLTGKVTLSGKVGRKPYKQTFDLTKVKADPNNAALRYLWARERIKYLDYLVINHDVEKDVSAKKILDLGLKYNLMTNYTSFVAIDEEVANKGGKQTKVKQVVPLPDGVSDYAVGMVTAEACSIVNAIPGTVIFEEEEVVEEEVFIIVEDDPEFPGGLDSLAAFIQRNLVYPKQAMDDKIEGTVFVSFTIERDGTVSNVRVLRDIGGGCGAEAVRIVKMMPKWKPGKQRGRTVRCQFNLPIKFRLE